jgi:hypothetical protein
VLRCAALTGAVLTSSMTGVSATYDVIASPAAMRCCLRTAGRLAAWRGAWVGETAGWEPPPLAAWAVAIGSSSTAKCLANPGAAR